MTTTPPPMPDRAGFVRASGDFTFNGLALMGGGSVYSEAAVKKLVERITALEADRKMLREALEAMQRHVEELCTVYGVPLPQATFDKASAALRTTHD
jgi:hypothetical protein